MRVLNPGEPAPTRTTGLDSGRGSGQKEWTRWVAGKLGVQTTSGIDWLRWIISTIIAAVGIVIYGKVTSKA